MRVTGTTFAAVLPVVSDVALYIMLVEISQLESKLLLWLGSRGCEMTELEVSVVADVPCT